MTYPFRYELMIIMAKAMQNQFWLRLSATLLNLSDVMDLVISNPILHVVALNAQLLAHNLASERLPTIRGKSEPFWMYGFVSPLISTIRMPDMPAPSIIG